MPVVIAGVGNELAGDDGIGIAAVRALRERPDLPAGVELLEIGTLGPAALSSIEPEDVVVFLDAVRAESPPGTISCFDLAEMPLPASAPISVHDLGLLHLLADAKLLGRPLRGILVGVEPGRIAPLERRLSTEVAEALPRLVDRVILEVRRLLEQGHQRPSSDSTARR